MHGRARPAPAGRGVSSSGKLIPRHVEETANDRPIPSGAQIGRYLAGDYTGTLFYYALCNLIPVVVATSLDASTNAFFYMAWVLGATVDVLAVNMAMSLTVEGAFDTVGFGEACRSVLRAHGADPRADRDRDPARGAAWACRCSGPGTPSTARRCCACWPSPHCRRH